MDREKHLARKRRYRERHIEEERERNRRWREANKAYLVAANRAWREAHPDRGYEGVKRWRENNPDLQAASARASACNRRAKAAGVPGHISRADVSALWERQPVCVRCGTGRGVDHIVAFCDGGLNTPDNIQNMCQDCNVLKQARLTADDVRALRAAYTAGERDRTVLGKRFGISAGNVWLIVTRKSWAEVV